MPNSATMLRWLGGAGSVALEPLISEQRRLANAVAEFARATVETDRGTQPAGSARKREEG